MSDRVVNGGKPLRYHFLQSWRTDLQEFSLALRRFLSIYFLLQFAMISPRVIAAIANLFPS